MSTSRNDVARAVETRAETRWFDAVIRVGVSLGLLSCIYLLTAQAVAWWHFRRGSAEEIQEAIRWDPANAEFYAARARLLQTSPDAGDLGEVIGLCEKATRLSPNRALYWAELGGSYEWAGREEEAHWAYQRAQQLFPHSPDINWKLGNFYLRTGRIHEALRALEKTVQGDRAMRRPAFDLVCRAGIPNQTILREMIPAEASIRLDYLNYLAETRRLDRAAEVWAQLLAGSGEMDVQAAFPYLDALIQQQHSEELRAAWDALMKRSRRAFGECFLDGNLIANGSFECESLNGGLDWRVLPCDGVAVGADTLTSFHGARSLRLHFEGTQNVAYSHLLQFVPVKPNTLYRFIAYARTEGVTSDSGPRFEVYDAGEKSRLSLASKAVLGTVGWSPQQLQFKTGPDTRLLVVRLARPASRAFAGRIAGTLWVDRVSLHAAE